MRISEENGILHYVLNEELGQYKSGVLVYVKLRTPLIKNITQDYLLSMLRLYLAKW